jgi:hypothetical protein
MYQYVYRWTIKRIGEETQRVFEAAVIEFARRDCGKPWAYKLRMCVGLAKNRSQLYYH